jgi:hypothetical protein
MIAYNPILIRNLSIVKKAKEWFNKELISLEQLDSILKKYKTEFYSPNLFVKIGLFIFTFFVVSAAYGFFSLTFMAGLFGSGYFIFSCFLFSALCVFTLEFYIKKNNLYNAGVDECLLYSALMFGFIAIGIIIKYEFEFFNDQTLLLSILSVPFFLAAIVRYSDRFVTLSLAICLYLIFFLSLLKLGEIAKLIMPFALMALSVLIYLATKKYEELEMTSEYNHWMRKVVLS